MALPGRGGGGRGLEEGDVVCYYLSCSLRRPFLPSLYVLSSCLFLREAYSILPSIHPSHHHPSNHSISFHSILRTCVLCLVFSLSLQFIGHLIG